MKLIIALITYNRWEYTHRTLKHFWRSAPEPENYTLVVVDNNSTDETKDRLKTLSTRGRIDQLILNPDNYYPGKATNIGWKRGLEVMPDATHLMRLDNDMFLGPGWSQAIESYFKAIPELGQLGLDHEAIEDPRAALRALEINGKTINPWPGCVGGPCVIRRSLYDMGVRYPEMMWNDGRNSPMQEDSAMSKKIQNLGYLVGHMEEDICRTFANKSNWADYPEYYAATMQDRGYDENVELLKKLKGDTTK